MKWFSLLLSFLIGKFNLTHSPTTGFKESIHLILDEIAFRSRKPAMLVLGGLICTALLCGGFFMSLIDLTTQFDRDGVVRATASNISGLVLVILTLGTFFWVFKRAWPGTKTERKVTEMKEPPSGLEHALTLLVMDFIKEREFKREERYQQHHPPPPEKEPTSPLYNN